MRFAAVQTEHIGEGAIVREADLENRIYYGMEIETEADYSMPERVMIYDVCE